MVKSQPKIDSDDKVKLVPNFNIEKDITNDVEDVKLSQDALQRIENACPHYSILKERYNTYKNPDDDGNPDKVPVPIHKRHGLDGFIALLGRADMTKDLTVQPTRLIKRYAYNEETKQREPYLIVNQLVVGLRPNGEDTNLCSITKGYYEYPLQFKKNINDEWEPVNNKFKKVYSIPFTTEAAKAEAEIGDPHIKKYVVENIDGTSTANLTYRQFVSLDETQHLNLAEGKKIV